MVYHNGSVNHLKQEELYSQLNAINKNMSSKMFWKCFQCSLTLQETKQTLKIAGPIALSGLMQFILPVITVLFVGHLGKTELAATGLAFSVANIAGQSLVVGSSVACDTLCSQAFGAGNYKRVGTVVQRGLLFISVQCFPVYSIWMNADRILLLLGQDPQVVKLAQEFLIYYMPGLAFILGFSVIKNLITCQGTVIPLIYSSFGAAGVNVLSNYLFIVKANLGVRGGALSTSIAYFTMFLLLYLIIKWRKYDKDVWQGWSWECLNDWRQFASLALPSSLAFFVEWSSFEIGTILLGMIGATELAVQSILINVTFVAFQIPFAVETAISIGVGNYMGAGILSRAKAVMRVGWLLQALLGTLYSILILLLRDYLGFMFTNNKNVVAMAADAFPTVTACIAVDGMQAVTLGGIRGLGLQKYAALINFVNYDVFALPIASFLALKTNLKVTGFWLGMGLGLVAQFLLYIAVLLKVNWAAHCRKVRPPISDIDISETVGVEILIGSKWTGRKSKTEIAFAQIRAGVSLTSEQRTSTDCETTSILLNDSIKDKDCMKNEDKDASGLEQTCSINTTEFLLSKNPTQRNTTAIPNVRILMHRILFLMISIFIVMMGAIIKILTIRNIL